jgi:hypothetical protein
VSNDEHPRCNAGDEGVGTREQLVRVPIQHGTLTRWSLRRLQELAKSATMSIHAATQATKESERANSLSECQSNTAL